MEFEKEINELEGLEFSDNYIIKKGSVPILFTAVHTMKQKTEDNSIKLNEPYTKAIALYLNKYADVNVMIKIKDTGLDSNKDNNDEFKIELIKFIKDNNIKLVIDLHGANKTRDFDIEFGTLNNLSADYSTIKELEEAFLENNIHNNQTIYFEEDIDVIQMEINSKYRDYKNLKNLEKLINSLNNFIKQYINKGK